MLSNDPATVYDAMLDVAAGDEMIESTEVLLPQPQLDGSSSSDGGGGRGPASSWSPRHEAHGDKAAAMLLPDQARFRSP